MSLVAGRGPLGADPAGWFSAPGPRPDVVFVEPHPRRIGHVLDGRTVIDTEHALMVHRSGHALSYAFPGRRGGRPSARARRRGARLRRTCRGTPSTRGSRRDASSCTTRRTPTTGSTAGPTAPRLRVAVAGTVLVDTVDTVIVFETSLAPRLYVDPRTGPDRPAAARSETTSYCNYKGDATYWSAVVGDTTCHDDVAWSYEDTPPETLPIRGFLSFDETRADVIAELPEAGGTARVRELMRPVRSRGCPLDGVRCSAN